MALFPSLIRVCADDSYETEGAPTEEIKSQKAVFNQHPHFSQALDLGDPARLLERFFGPPVREK